VRFSAQFVVVLSDPVQNELVQNELVQNELVQSEARLGSGWLKRPQNLPTELNHRKLTTEH
jgi:hypothetical protein